MDNTRFHFQDDNVQRLLDAPSIIGEYLRAGLIALLFAAAQPGPTYACDAAGDGITNPAPIDGNALASLNADDDGGSFHARAAALYRRPATGDRGAADGPPPITTRGGRPRDPAAGADARRPDHGQRRPSRRGAGGHDAARAERPSAGRVVRHFTLVAGSRALTLRWRVPTAARARRYSVDLRIASVSGMRSDHR
jgi:hypothetical protein